MAVLLQQRSPLVFTRIGDSNRITVLDAITCKQKWFL